MKRRTGGRMIRLGTTVRDASCPSMLILMVGAVVVVQLLYCTATTTQGASANNKQQCYWLSMSIGGSGSTAVKSDALVAVPLGLAVVACCGPRLLPRQLAVLPDGMVPGTICPGMYTYIRILGRSCVLRSFTISRVCGSSCSLQSSAFVSPPSSDAPA